MQNLKLAVQHILADVPLKSSLFTRWNSLYRILFNSRWTILLLLLIGFLRGLLFLGAYAPADGADGGDYYIYSAYIAGYDLPDRAANLSPIYPFFVYLNHYLLGQFNLIIVWQFIMSMMTGLMMYLGLRQYHPVLAFMVAGVVSGDAQIGILFNFTSTEPLYIFLLCMMFALAIALPAGGIETRWSIRSVCVGILLALLRETRTVATYIFVPVMVLYALHKRRWQHILQVVVSFIISAFLLNSMFHVFQAEQTSSANHLMYLRPLIRNDMLDPSAGEASQELSRILNLCRSDYAEQGLMSCLIESIEGEESERTTLIEQAYQEALIAKPAATIEASLLAFHDFLSESGQQYRGTPTPAEVQCSDITARQERFENHFLTIDWVDIDLTNEQRDSLTEVTTDFVYQMCPTWFESDIARQITDYLALRYRSLSRPNPYRWNILLFAVIVLIPWMRRYWYPYLLALSLWLYHASISAVVLNVQPRYIAVTNPMKAVIITLMLFFIMQLAIRVVDALIWTRKKQEGAFDGEYTD